MTARGGRFDLRREFARNCKSQRRIFVCHLKGRNEVKESAAPI